MTDMPERAVGADVSNRTPGENASADPAPGSDPVQPTGPGMNMRGNLVSIGRSLIINGAVPLVIYNLLKGHGASDLTALGVAAVVPAIDGLGTVARRRRIDLISAIVLVGLAVSAVAVLVGGDPRLLLIRESFVTLALGLACFISFAFPRPLMFYFGRYFSTGDDPEKVSRYNALWQYPYFRHVNRVITLVWGVVYVGEFVLRVVMVSRLSINEVLALSPLVFNGIVVAVIAWTLAYSRFAWRRGTRMAEEAMGSATPVS